MNKDDYGIASKIPKYLGISRSGEKPNFNGEN